MDAKFQPSFIPKQPLASIPRMGPGTINVLYIIASIFFIITLGIIGVVLIKERQLNQDIVSLNGELVKAEASFEISTIQELKRVSARTKIANTLLDSHVALSKFLEELQNVTYNNVSFSSLQVTTTGSAVNISLDGIAGNYNSIILQLALLKNLSYLKAPTFSNFALDDEGSVSFTFSATLDSKLISYARSVTEK